MKVYGFSHIDAERGEIECAEFDDGANVLDLFQAIEFRLGWEWAYAQFRSAQRQLVRMLLEDGADAELIRGVRGMRSGDVPVCFLRSEDAP